MKKIKDITNITPKTRLWSKINLGKNEFEGLIRTSDKFEKLIEKTNK